MALPDLKEPHVIETDTPQSAVTALLARAKASGMVTPEELDQLFVAPAYQGRSLGRQLLAFTRMHLPDEIHLRCVRENEKAWRWYEREGFVYEKEEVAQATGFMMKYYRWKSDS